MRLCRPLLASAIDLPVQRPQGSEACDPNKTRPCSFKPAEVAHWYVPAVCAQLGIKPCVFGWKRASSCAYATRAQTGLLPADLCERFSLQAACSLRYASGMHVPSRQRLDSFRKAAGGGMCMRYRRDRANPIAIAAQNGPRLQLATML